jgi:hypothetical protein
MNDIQLSVLFAKHSQNVIVSCDNEHAHSALQDCLSPKATGDEKDVIICKLCEIILNERRVARELLSKITGD